MGVEQAPHRLDPVDDSGFEAPLAEIRFHGAANGFPARRSHLGMDAPVTQDFHIVSDQQKIDQHTVIGFRIPDAQLGKDFDRPFPGGYPFQQNPQFQGSFHGETDFPVMPGFGQRYGRPDAIQGLGGQGFPNVHAADPEMPGDSLPIHAYHLPEAPPPPKLPPPPPKPPPNPPPPPPNPPPKPPPRPPRWPIAPNPPKPPPTRPKISAPMPRSTPRMTEPSMKEANNPTSPPEKTPPRTRPKMERK